MADIEQWLLWMETERKLSARTRRQRFSFFSGMMYWAVVNEIIGRNPCKKIKHAGSRAKEIRWGPEHLLFPNVSRTGYLYASYLYRQIWLVALSQGEVAYCKPHSMRHYYGSRFLYAGVPENDVADWMGHSGTDVLREHYHYIFEGAEIFEGPSSAGVRPSHRC
ncbi:hypothetical protein ACF06W_18110 [Streptomyces albus]|uniref:hypothetical protein n=1 Tax=Streptomyces albus TaxID=1888 RepID=UPI0036FD3820